MIWQRYGDAQPIEDRYAALRLYMTQWQKFATQVDKAKNGKAKSKKGKSDYRIIGDWVALEKGTSREFIGRVFGYLLSRHMAEFARITGHDGDVRTFTDLAAHFRAEVIRKHIAPDGTVTGDTQTAYALVCRHHLYEPAQEQLIHEKFHQRMLADKYAVLTGFHGAGNLLQGLTAVGLATDAGKTILNEVPPSWGGMVKLGATTIWERWEGKSADGFYSPKMNSFNHYTFGGCGEWMIGYLVGLRQNRRDSRSFTSNRRSFRDSLGRRPASSRLTAPSRIVGSAKTATLRCVWSFRPTAQPASSCRPKPRILHSRVAESPCRQPADDPEVLVKSGRHEFSWAE